MVAVKYHVGDRVVLTPHSRLKLLSSEMELLLEPHEFFLIARQRLGMTQAELAKLLGVERRSIVRYETSGSAIPETIWTEIKQFARDPEAVWAEISKNTNHAKRS